MLNNSNNRPAWTQYDLCAYRHKHAIIHGKFRKLKDYYEKNKGEQK